MPNPDINFHNSPKLNATQISIDQRVVKHSMTCSHNTVSLSNKKEPGIDASKAWLNLKTDERERPGTQASYFLMHLYCSSRKGESTEMESSPVSLGVGQG
jgi:hypothetical protein